MAATRGLGFVPISMEPTWLEVEAEQFAAIHREYLAVMWNLGVPLDPDVPSGMVKVKAEGSVVPAA